MQLSPCGDESAQPLLRSRLPGSTLGRGALDRIYDGCPISGGQPQLEHVGLPTALVVIGFGGGTPSVVSSNRLVSGSSTSSVVCSSIQRENTLVWSPNALFVLAPVHPNAKSDYSASKSRGLPVNRSYASRYRDMVFSTTSSGRRGPGGVLSQSPLATTVSR